MVTGRVNVRFGRITSDGEYQSTEAGFRIWPIRIAVTDDDIDIGEMAQMIQTQAEGFNTNSSGWSVEQVLNATINTSAHRPCEGSS